MNPVIGVTANVSLRGDPKRTFSKNTDIHLIQDDYIEFIETAGGVPILLPVIGNLREVASLVERVDGIIITGGVDVDPTYYGEENTHSLGVNQQRDTFELKLIEEARKRKVPIMAICRGSQVLNIAFGGSLYQDIPTSVKDSVKHTREADDPETFHKARLIGNSFLNEIFGAEEITINSSHHQAVRKPGEGLTVICKAVDGIVEAFQCRQDFCTVGVQWHPERLHDDPVQIDLGRWFIQRVKETI